MTTLIPTEAWKFSLKDVVTGLLSIFSTDCATQELHISGIGRAITARSGRAGIVIALKALGLARGAGIGVPLYCCPVVFKAIAEAGYRPVFIDTEPDDYTISPSSAENRIEGVEAIIAVHMFGNLCDIPTLIKVLNGKPLIEDCAQSLGSSFEGMPSGSFGAISVFSFRSGKYLSVGEGGALVAKDLRIRDQIKRLIDKMPTPRRTEVFLHVFKTYLRSKLRRRPLWGLAGSLLWSFYNKKVNFIDKSTIHLGRAMPSDIILASLRMNSLERTINKQRSNANFFIENIALPKEMLNLERTGRILNRFMFPIRLRSARECDYFADILLKRSISTSRPYYDVLQGAPKHYGYEGDCPNAESLLRRTLVIPVHYELRMRDLERIVSAINSAWKLAEKA